MKVLRIFPVVTWCLFYIILSGAMCQSAQQKGQTKEPIATDESADKPSAPDTMDKEEAKINEEVESAGTEGMTDDGSVGYDDPVPEDQPDMIQDEEPLPDDVITEGDPMDPFEDSTPTDNGSMDSEAEPSEEDSSGDYD